MYGRLVVASVCFASVGHVATAHFNCSQRNVSAEIAAAVNDMTDRKIKMGGNALPFLIVPAFALAGIMPWIVPGLKMAVGFVGMINQMAFMSALFTLIRNYIFNSQPEEHIVYLNSGYEKKPHHHR